MGCSLRELPTPLRMTIPSVPVPLSIRCHPGIQEKVTASEPIRRVRVPSLDANLGRASACPCWLRGCRPYARFFSRGLAHPFPRFQRTARDCGVPHPFAFCAKGWEARISCRRRFQFRVTMKPERDCDGSLAPRTRRSEKRPGEP